MDPSTSNLALESSVQLSTHLPHVSSQISYAPEGSDGRQRVAISLGLALSQTQDLRTPSAAGNRPFRSSSHADAKAKMKRKAKTLNCVATFMVF
jgi:hypothetical protein